VKKPKSRAVKRVSSTKRVVRPKKILESIEPESPVPMIAAAQAPAPATGGPPVSGKLVLGVSCTIHEAQALRRLPVIALGLDDEANLALRRAGLKTVGDVAKRPAASIAARFGAGSVTALRRLLGDEQAPINPLPHAEPFRFERRFAEPVALEISISAYFLDLLKEAAQALEQRALGGRRFVLTLIRSDGARHALVIETGQPTRDPDPVMRLFDERIAALADPLDPGFGYGRSGSPGHGTREEAFQALRR